MTAEILPFAKKVDNDRLFQSFDDVFEYVIQEPVWVASDLSESDPGAAEAQRLLAWFRWFGVEVDVAGPPQSLLEGWAFLRSEIGTAALYRTKHPDTFNRLHDEWTKKQVEYLDAVIRGDMATARALIRRVPLWLQLVEKFDTADGSALLAAD